MSEISELERRITAALDRIAKGVEQLDAVPEIDAASTAVDEAVEQVSAGADLAALEQALSDEKMANSQLEERLRALRTKLDKQSLEADMKQAELKDALLKMDTALKEAVRTSQDLRDSSEALRRAAQEGVDAGVVDAAMAAELDALKAERLVEASETAALAAALEPLLEPQESA